MVKQLEEENQRTPSSASVEYWLLCAPSVSGIGNRNLSLYPLLRQTDKTLLTVRCKFIVPNPGTDLG
jgi:hypothetical protein